MTLTTVLYLSICFCNLKIAQSDDEGQPTTKSFHGSVKGKIFSKSGSVISRQTTESVNECCFKCMQNKKCLSVNTIPLDQLHYQCELLNSTGKGFDKYLVPKANAKFMQLQTACYPNPCQNGGNCTVEDEGASYTCTCVNHTGRNCEINLCSPNPCQNGGKCTLTDQGASYTCTCVSANAEGPNCEIKKCILFDFETGRLDNWTLTGTAFNNQPTYGDNSLYRDAKVTSNLKGDWYIGTVDYRPSPLHPAGGRQGDEHTGTATSPPFVIQGTKLRFLIGGCSDINIERLELLIGGSVVRAATSTRTRNAMEEKEFDVTALRGQVAQVRIIDVSSVSWGFINVDHIEEIYC